MLRYLPIVIQSVLLIYCLIDCIQTDSLLVRNLPKSMWVLLIVFLPLVGSVAWLVAGRPAREQRPAPWPATGTSGFPEYERPRPPRGPDDDPDFLREMRRGNQEHEALLRSWEENLRRREQQAAATSRDDDDDVDTDVEARPEGGAEEPKPPASA